jgi:hypothetical protein
MKSKGKTRVAKRLLAPGPRIVRAWFDTVINPLLKGLSDERSRLLTLNWTWQFRPGVLESIWPAEHYVPSAARANFQQFLEFYPTIDKNVAQHDKLVLLLREACKRLHETIVSRSPLPSLYSELTTEESLHAALQKHGRGHRLAGRNWTEEDLLSEIFGGYPPTDHVAVLAQYITNNTGTLPDHITTAPFWNEHRETLLSVLRDVPEVRKQYTETSSVGSRLMKTSDALSIELQQIRLKLSVKYDVPYVEPLSVESESKWYV